MGQIKQPMNFLTARSGRWIGLWGLSLSLWLLPVGANAAEFSTRQLTNAQQQSTAIASVLQQPANVIYLGETHDQAADHQAQLAIIQALQQQKPGLTIGLEMVQRPYQAALDRYIAGEIDEPTMRDRIEYDDRWGFDWEMYAPIFRYAKAQQIPLIALNTPREITRKVSKRGLTSLNLPDRRFIPPISAIEIGPAPYKTMLTAILQQNHGTPDQPPKPDRIDRFVQAQVLWDETMAERIAQAHQHNPDRPIVVLVGQGHLIYRYGIPRRVERRIPGIKQQVILLSPDPSLPTVDAEGTPIADWWLKPTTPESNPSQSQP
ncbi:MAG: hypothetical protein RLZZ511_2932 [Cyanobacteriota bacterium]|jgi:uncharacterized iron-regulated protein